MGNIFSIVSMAAHSPPLNMAPIYIFIFKQLGIQLVSESIHFHESPNSESIQRMHCHILALQLVFISSSQCCQVICRATICSKGVSSAIHLSSNFTFLQSRLFLSQFHGCFITSKSTFVPCFMSMMGETSWPSFDNSIHVDFNTSSGNWT